MTASSQLIQPKVHCGHGFAERPPHSIISLNSRSHHAYLHLVGIHLCFYPSLCTKVIWLFWYGSALFTQCLINHWDTVIHKRRSALPVFYIKWLYVSEERLARKELCHHALIWMAVVCGREALELDQVGTKMMNTPTSSRHTCKQAWSWMLPLVSSVLTLSLAAAFALFSLMIIVSSNLRYSLRISVCSRRWQT